MERFENGQILNTQITFAGHESSNFDSGFVLLTSTLAIAQGYSGEGSRKYAKQFNVFWNGLLITMVHLRA